MSENISKGFRVIGKEKLVSAQILLVEDNVDLREITTELLVNAGYQVSSASNGLEALELFKRNKFDLIITDIFMPVFDGNQFIRELEKMHGHLEVPPLIAISYSHFDILPNPIITQTALKPFKTGQLRSLISYALEEGRPNEFNPDKKFGLSS